MARTIHLRSTCRDGPFVPVHCAALPASLLESELFGHEKGAFTGATTRRQGRFELAHGGTLFLDEVGEIDPDVQVKLLRVLQERQFERIGGNETIRMNVRLIAATNRELEREVREGRFREDLYYRLNVIPITVPPLRERPEDIRSSRPISWNITGDSSGGARCRFPRAFWTPCARTIGREACGRFKTSSSAWW